MRWSSTEMIRYRTGGASGIAVVEVVMSRDLCRLVRTCCAEVDTDPGGCAASDVPHQGQGVGLADAGGEVHLGTVGQPVVGDARVQLLEGDAQLHASQVRPQAEVVTAAEGEVLVRLSV